MCGAHAAVRHLLGGMMQATHPLTIVDMEAGLEHLSRGTARHVDTLLVMLEPYYKALETGRRAAELGREIGVKRVAAVANKLRDDADRVAVRAFAAAHGLEILAEVPLDDRIRKSDLTGGAAIDVPDSPAVAAIGALARAFETGPA
jgi:CO dehydrogenase maturation factor